MTVESLSAAAGLVLSLCASYLPGFSGWYDLLDADFKRLVMLALLLATSLVCYGLACAGLGTQLGLSLSCDQEGAISLLRTFISALIANQSAYAITPRAR